MAASPEEIARKFRGGFYPAIKEDIREIWKKKTREVGETPKELAAIVPTIEEISEHTAKDLAELEENFKIASEGYKKIPGVVQELEILDPKMAHDQAIGPLLAAEFLLDEYNRKMLKLSSRLFRKKDPKAAEKHINALLKTVDNYVEKHALPRAITAIGYRAKGMNDGEAIALQKKLPETVAMLRERLKIMGLITLALHGDKEAREAVARLAEEAITRGRVLLRSGRMPKIDDNRIEYMEYVLKTYGKRLGVPEDYIKKIEEINSAISQM